MTFAEKKNTKFLFCEPFCRPENTFLMMKNFSFCKSLAKGSTLKLTFVSLSLNDVLLPGHNSHPTKAIFSISCVLFFTWGCEGVVRGWRIITVTLLKFKQMIDGICVN